ncbi:N-6 DNA methylase [Anaerolineales bacterium HSG24]|nr:N-6 DNA methylase [Anaerolineales bacterium HSG24]
MENGDTLAEPSILNKKGKIETFDRVLANPPFSQNYSRAEMQFASRFWEFCPEAGKKADLMFVQHMIASLKTEGLMATIMPHGVLFRGGKEKLIRERMIQDDLIEAIISLPPGLFYGTGIPACVLVINKSKPDVWRGKTLFINADREYAEGKAQNKLRPEDIEKIDFVFTHKREITKYSRLVDKSEIADQHDYNLNIRRYVDNTPDPEPEDVTAHLLGGLPLAEVEARYPLYEPFGIPPSRLFQLDAALPIVAEAPAIYQVNPPPEMPPELVEGGELVETGLPSTGSGDALVELVETMSPSTASGDAGHRAGYTAFTSTITRKADIKTRLEQDKQLQATMQQHVTALADWWSEARDEFATLSTGKKLPTVRQNLLTSLKARLIPLRVLDEFLSAGVFVNWWQTIRYDLKTIINTGWHHTLIPDAYLIQAFFQAEAAAIATQEATISQAESDLSEAVEQATTETAYEPDEGKKVTASLIKKYLKSLQDDLKESAGKSAARERASYKSLYDTIITIEKRRTKAKRALIEQETLLELKLRLKRVGPAETTAETNDLLQQVADQLDKLNPKDRTDKKKITSLNRDKTALQARLSHIKCLLTEIKDPLTEAEARDLILQKLHDLIETELDRYLNQARRHLITSTETLWDKYAASSQQLERERGQTLVQLNQYLEGLGYLV